MKRYFKLMKKYFIILLAVCMLFTEASEVYAANAINDYPNSWTLTGNNVKDILTIALSQEGYQEIGTNHTKYCKWYYGSDTSAAWCAIFISWCAYYAGIPTTVIHKNATASGFSVSSKNSNSFGCPGYAFSETSAKAGDIVYIDNTGNKVSNHVGLVYSVDSNYIYTIEGNVTDACQKKRYRVSDGCLIYASGSASTITSILFYARPNYGTTAVSSIPVITTSTTGEETVTEEITDCDQWYEVTATGLNVRKGPGTSYSSRGSINTGTQIEVTGTALNGTWGRFTYNGADGWVSLQYCKKIDSPSSEDLTLIVEPSSETSSQTTVSAVDVHDIYECTTTSLNVRKGPGTSYTVIGKLTNGQQVGVESITNNWAKIDYNGSIGYCSAYSLKYVKAYESESETDTSETGTSETDTSETGTSETGTSETGTSETSTSETGTSESETTGSETGASETPAASTVSYKVTASSLIVRSGAGTSYSRLGSLTKGTVCQVSEVKNGWGKIVYNNSIGWISLSYCQKVESASGDNTSSESSSQTTVSAVDVHNIYECTVKSLNVRKGPGTSYTIIGKLTSGQQVGVESIANNWAKIDYNGSIGYCSAKSLKFVKAYVPSSETDTSSTETETSETGTSETSTSETGTSETSTTETGTSETSTTETGTSETGTTGSETGASETPAASTVSYKVTASSLIVRSGAGTSYSRLGSLTKGTVCQVSEVKNGWGKIVYNNSTGWISLSYCQKVETTAGDNTSSTEKTSETSSETSVTTETLVSYTVTASSLIVRSGPGTSYSRLGSVTKGTVLAVDEIKNNWGRISYQGKTGWVSLGYCKKTASLNSSLPAALAAETVEETKDNARVIITVLDEPLKYQISEDMLPVMTGWDEDTLPLTITENGTEENLFLNKGDFVEVLEITSSGWGHITYLDTDGWIDLSKAVQIPDTSENTDAAADTVIASETVTES